MSPKRLHQSLTVLCPALALAAGTLLISEFPQYAWLSGTGVVAALGALLIVTRPSTLEETISRFDRALGRAPAGMMLLDLDGQILWTNAALAQLASTAPDALLGQSFESLFTGDAWRTIQTEQAALLQGAQIEVEGYVNVADDQRIWTHGFANLLRDDRDRPECIVVQVLDLTAARAAQSAISIAESRLQQTLELTSDLVITLDARGRMTRTNQRANELLLRGADSLIGASVLEFIDPEDRKTFISAFNASRKTPGAHRTIENLQLLCGGLLPSRQKLPREFCVKLVSLPGSSPTTTVVCQDVTDRNQSRDLLRSTEARFSRIFHSSPDAIVIIRHRDSLILDFNESFSRLLGHRREDAIGHLETELNLFVDLEERRRVLSILERNKECTDEETTLRTRNADLVPVEISVRYIEIDGELCMICIGRDITKRMSAERALRESEEKFEQVFTESPDGVIILRLRDMTICDVNDAFMTNSEYAREELVGRPITELEASTANATLENTAEHMQGQGRFSNREIIFRTKTGRLVTNLVSAKLIDLQGVPCALCIVKDVNELRDAQERLRLSEQRFRGAFENAPIGILLVNIDGSIFQSNRFASELLAYNEKPLEGVHISRLIPADDRSQFKETLTRLISGKDETVRTERRMLCKDGLQIWTNFHIGLQREDDGAPRYCIVQITDITEMKNSHRKIERMAFYDTLTDLANRRLFYDRLSHAIDQSKRSRSLAALLYLDLDQFKRVNDTLGHEVGDMLLQEVASRLSVAVRTGDTVGRPGGDEFTILLTDIKRPTDAGLVAEKILHSLRAPLTISGHQLIVTTSIGITIIPEDGTDANELMKNADLAMYRAKDHGRNNYQFYSEEMNTNAVKRLRTEYELRRALDKQEFELYFQPKVRLRDQLTTGVECLVRWRHPERGLLSPVEFIAVAEETGAIIDLGSWIISAACSAGHRLANHVGRDIEIAINISPRQFQDPNLIPTIRKSLRETGLHPGNLEIEITETMLMGDIEAANQTLLRLHQLGVKLAIDDFGTGYSSLNYLKKFPIDTVKVDRTFLADIPHNEDDKAITAAVIAMAHRLNMAVVAEGVETSKQLEFLQENRCEYAQGFLFSKPLTFESLSSLLAPNVHLLRGE